MKNGDKMLFCYEGVNLLGNGKFSLLLFFIKCAQFFVNIFLCIIFSDFSCRCKNAAGSTDALSTKLAIFLQPDAQNAVHANHIH